MQQMIRFLPASSGFIPLRRDYAAMDLVKDVLRAPTDYSSMKGLGAMRQGETRSTPYPPKEAALRGGGASVSSKK